MKFGLTDEEYAQLDRWVVSPLKKFGAQVWIFGSRARGDHKTFSDVDILYSLQPSLRLADLGNIRETIEESNFPFKVDLVDENVLAESYREQVLRERIGL
jgi:predicted nucleotidyltransferase